MVFRNFILLSVALLSLSACSSDEEAAGGPDVAGAPGVGAVAGDGLAGAGAGAPVNGVVPGTQQDLVVNVGDRVFFAYDQSDISDEARATLDRQVTWLKQYPAVNITIEGHADERGTREYNLALGERRASSVRSYLLSQGIDAARINTISYGKERPAVPENNAAAWSQNRRGVTVVN